MVHDLGSVAVPPAPFGYGARLGGGDGGARSEGPQGQFQGGEGTVPLLGPGPGVRQLGGETGNPVAKFFDEAGSVTLGRSRLVNWVRPMQAEAGGEEYVDGEAPRPLVVLVGAGQLASSEPALERCPADPARLDRLRERESRADSGGVLHLDHVGQVESAAGWGTGRWPPRGLNEASLCQGVVFCGLEARWSGPGRQGVGSAWVRE
jgi:hypothetical protein